MVIFSRPINRDDVTCFLNAGPITGKEMIPLIISTSLAGLPLILSRMDVTGCPDTSFGYQEETS